jgi:type I restriction enzyme R subunit
VPEDLFGPGQDKKEFYVFDPWGNFADFGAQTDATEDEAPRPKSLLERLFVARIDLLAAAIDALDEPLVQHTTALLVPRPRRSLQKTGRLTVR